MGVWVIVNRNTEWKVEIFYGDYGIEVNGVEGGRVTRSSPIRLEVPAGAINIRGRIGWKRTNNLSLKIEEGETIALDVGTKLHSFGIVGFIHALIMVGIPLGFRQFSLLHSAVMLILYHAWLSQDQG